MKKIQISLVAVCLLGLSANAFDLNDAINTGSKVLSSSSTSDSSLQTKGMKEALDVGVKYAVKSLSGSGFLDNQNVKIPLPKSVQKIADVVSKFGGQSYVDKLQSDMNLAAGEAISKSTPVFTKAISDMSVSDATKIINGKDDAATTYFKDKTSAELTTLVKPIIQKATANNQLASSYKALVNQFNANGGSSLLSGDLANQAKGIAGALGVDVEKYTPMSDEDLDSYVTRKALDGTFYMIGEEEAKIRKNPLSYGSDIIKQVFGK